MGDDRVQEEKRSLGQNLIEWLKLIVLALIISFLLTRFVFQRNSVFGHSMEPTLQDGDQIFVEKVSRYFPGSIKRGDIITIDTELQEHEHSAFVIKRVVGLPGEQVEIKDGAVYINGELLLEPYLSAGTRTDLLSLIHI